MSQIYKIEKHPFGTDGLPPDPPVGIMWLFIDEDKPYAIDFICPCGCRTSCYLTLTNSGRKRYGPQWDYSEGPNGPTISPSIRYMGGCKAHFNITNGQVIIHNDSGK